MTKETVKAVRIVRGFNPDLRVKLNNADRNALYDFIESNRIALLGMKYAIAPDPVSDDWNKYENAIWNAVSQVVNGTYDS